MDYPAEGRTFTAEEIRAKLEEAYAWYDSIGEFIGPDGFDLQRFKDWGLERIQQLSRFSN